MEINILIIKVLQEIFVCLFLDYYFDMLDVLLFIDDLKTFIAFL